jgi:hypothetical protein
VRVRAVHGEMVNLFTSERISTDADGKKYDMDLWIKAQLEAGKLELVTD